MLDTPNPPNSLVYSAHRQVFKGVASILKVSSTRLNGHPVERRELHIATQPVAKDLQRKFEAVVFRLVENSNENPKDKNGHSIVGGVNTFPEPVHVVLFVTPEAIAMLSQRASANDGANKLGVSICPGINLLEWDQSGAIPIYEYELHCG